MKNLKLFICITCILAMGCFVLAGCGSNDSTSGNNTQENNSGSDNANGSTGDDGSVIGGAVDDIADGVGDAVEDITSGFTNYSDAHDYFMDRMGKENANAQYELRNESEDLTTYDGSNKGYHFELYDTANNSDGKKVGDFYLEPNSGKIYQKDASTGKFNEYKFSNQSGTNGTGTGNSGNGTGNANGGGGANGAGGTNGTTKTR